MEQKGILREWMGREGVEYEMEIKRKGKKSKGKGYERQQGTGEE